MFRRIAVAAVAVCLTTVAMSADAAFSGIDKGTVKVEANAKLLGKFAGKVTGVSVAESGGNLVFSSDLSDKLDMGVRQSHCKEVFEVDQNKEDKDKKDESAEKKRKKAKGRFVTLTVDKSKLKIPADKETVSGEVSGDLKLRGVTKSVKVKYTVSRTGTDYHISDTKFSFNYTDFGVEKICKATICVDPLVSITVDGVKIRDKP